MSRESESAKEMELQGELDDLLDKIGSYVVLEVSGFR